jgi:hypothetical protein
MKKQDERRQGKGMPVQAFPKDLPRKICAGAAMGFTEFLFKGLHGLAGRPRRENRCKSADFEPAQGMSCKACNASAA